MNALETPRLKAACVVAAVWLGPALGQAEEAPQWRFAQTTTAAQKAASLGVKQVEALLAAPWDAVVVAVRRDMRCTGVLCWGFKLQRRDRGVAVSPWCHHLRHEQTGPAKELPPLEVATLLSQTLDFFAAAAASVTPEERMSPTPLPGSEDLAVWMKEYQAIGGLLTAGDAVGLEVQVYRQGQIEIHFNPYREQALPELSSWVSAFGDVPTRAQP